MGYGRAQSRGERGTCTSVQAPKFGGNYEATKKINQEEASFCRHRCRMCLPSCQRKALALLLLRRRRRRRHAAAERAYVQSILKARQKFEDHPGIETMNASRSTSG